MTGGGSLLGGLEELIEEKTGINTVTAEDPMTAVANRHREICGADSRQWQTDRVRGFKQKFMDKIKGYIDHLIFRNSDNGYTVMVVNHEGEELTCVGTFPVITEGELIEATGHYTEHAVYGTQFQIQKLEIKDPEDTAAIERYLGSGVIKGSESHWQPGLCGNLKKILFALWKKSRNDWRKSKESVRKRPVRSQNRYQKKEICEKR